MTVVHDALVGCLSKVLLGIIELLLEQADLPSQGLVRVLRRRALLLRRLVLLQAPLELLELALGNRQPVRERGDLLVLLQDLLLVLLYLRVRLLGPRGVVVGFDTECSEALWRWKVNTKH